MTADRQKQAYTYAISAIIIWATVASAFKLTLRYVDYFQLLLYSTTVSLLTLFFLLIVQKKINVLKTYTLKEYIQSMILGFLNPFLYYIVLFKAYSLLPAQQAQPLNYTWPIMVVVLSIPLLHQRIHLKNIIAVLISFCGVIIITTQGDIQNYQMENLPGVLLALGSAVIWAIFWIINLRDKRDIIVKLFLNFTFGLLFILLITPLFSFSNLPPIMGMYGIIYIGIFEMGITFMTPTMVTLSPGRHVSTISCKSRQSMNRGTLPELSSSGISWTRICCQSINSEFFPRSRNADCLVSLQPPTLHMDG